MMEALDGNAIGGVLREAFGGDMTTATGRCAGCDTTWQIAELEVHVHAPAPVARCRTCGDVLMVLVTVRGFTCVHTPGLLELGNPATA